MPIEKNPRGDRPKIARTAFIHPTAVLVGHVIVGKNAFIGPLAVLRADEPAKSGNVEPIVLGDGVNVQDGAIVHALGGSEVRVGSQTSLSHGVIVHGPARIGRNCFIGFRSIVFGATINPGSLVMHHCLVENATLPRNHCLPSGAMLRGEKDLHQLLPVDASLRAFAERIVCTNLKLAQGYAQTAAQPLPVSVSMAFECTRLPGKRNSPIPH